MSYQPPFDITSKIVSRISSIAEQVGRIDAQSLKASPQLRKQNKVQTIQSTLAIEGNTLSVDQVTAILDGKRVLGQPREIKEVQGAIRAYETLPNWNPTHLKDLLAAHYQLMADILVDAGKFCKGGVGIQKGDQSKAGISKAASQSGQRDSQKLVSSIQPLNSFNVCW